MTFHLPVTSPAQGAVAPHAAELLFGLGLQAASEPSSKAIEKALMFAGFASSRFLSSIRTCSARLARGLRQDRGASPTREGL